jgi:hypothetical protein
MSPTPNAFQPRLFGFSESVVLEADLFPPVWHSLELLTSPNMDDREAGLDELVELNAQYSFPLAAYVLATRLEDKDSEFRTKVVQVLGRLLSPGEGFEDATEGVKQTLKAYLAQMRQRKIFALLQVSESDPPSQTYVAVLLKTCSNAGKTLSEIFSDRKLPLEIRLQAIQLVGIVGFLEAVPRLERLAMRLEGRLNGQSAMSFVTNSDSREKVLLPAIQTALTILNSP